MAQNATASSSQSSCPGPWCEAVLASSVTVSFATTVALSFTMPAQGSGSAGNLVGALPISTCFITATSTAIQGGANSGLPAGVGVVSCLFDSTTTPANIDLVLCNSSTNTTATVASGVRVIFLQVDGK